MGIGVVLLFLAVVGTILAAVSMLVLGNTTAAFTRGVPRGRRRVIVAACLFPFACLAWAAIVFVFQAIVSEVVLHRDVGLGDTWHAPLQNGYQIRMIDVTDHGSIYNPALERDRHGVEKGVNDVRSLQIAGPFIIGGIGESNQITSYFLLDTRTGEKKEPPNSDALRRSVLQLGIEMKLEPIETVYHRYRFSYFDVVVALVLCIPPVLGVLVLVRWIVRLRRTRVVPQA